MDVLGPVGSGRVSRRIPGSTSTGVANICSIAVAPGDERRVSRRAVPLCAQPRAGDGVRLVAEPVHGLRPPLHVLLRAGVRAARRPALGRPLRHEHPRQDERRRACCARELARPSWQREHVAIGAATDPYQPAEGRYRLTRACIEVLGAAANAVLDHHARPDDRARRRRARRGGAAREGAASRSRSRRSTTEIWRRTEPGTAPPHQRLRALHAARRRRHQGRRRHGADPARASATGPSCSPTSSAPRARRARPAIWANLLHLEPGTREHFLAALERDWPELLPELRARSTRRGAYLPASETKPVREQVRELARTHGIRDRRRIKLEPPPEPEQLQLGSLRPGATCLPVWHHRIARTMSTQRDHLPDRRRPRGRPRRPAAVALAGAAHPRHRRGRRRRERDRARRAAPPERRDHGRPHARAWTGSRRRRS